MFPGSSITSQLTQAVSNFDKRFDSIFGGSNIEDTTKEVAKRALSNLLGGIGYFYGSSSVGLGKKTADATEEILEFGPAPLLTAVPSRSFFPRGFLWDEGFHQVGYQALLSWTFWMIFDRSRADCYRCTYFIASIT